MLTLRSIFQSISQLLSIVEAQTFEHGFRFQASACLHEEKPLSRVVALSFDLPRRGGAATTPGGGEDVSSVGTKVEEFRHDRIESHLSIRAEIRARLC